MMNILAAIYLVIGSYGLSTNECLKVYSFDEETGETEYVCGCKGISNPSFISVAPDGNHMYAVGEDEGITSTANSVVFDKAKKTLDLTSSQLTYGGSPCNITLSPYGQYVYTANYFGGSITQFPVCIDGKLHEGREIKFKGKSKDKERQDHPYLHAVNFTPDNKYMIANDLGTDRLHIYPLSYNNQKETIDDKHMFDLKIKAGAGPRHLCFDKDGCHAYLISELSGEVFVIKYDRNKKHPFEVIQTAKADSLNAGGSADIHISNDGKFLYTSHRLKGDGISIFNIDADGMIRKIGYQSTGTHPRNFAITPNDKYLLVACRDTNEVEIYERDQSTGMLKDTGKRIKMDKPVCLKFFE